ncbi:MAG: FAD/NAD(P)-binding protein [Clostridia bacterium]|nr:FAD/NAD(P)-binding protein [Clostridia bacterium]
MNNIEALIPVVCEVTDIRRETPDVKTFRVIGLDGKKPFEHKPGQCAMLSIPGVGEALFSITSSPTNKDFLEFSIKKCGCVTDVLHAIEPGQQVTVRGPYGNPFPVDTVFAGKDLLFIAGGIGLAPLRSVINYVRDKRENYGKVAIVYGARSADDLVQLKEIEEEWKNEKDFDVYLTIDRPQDGWEGHVGFVPTYAKEIGIPNTYTAVLCGPPIMIKFTLAGLLEQGFEKKNIYTTLELRMKCGIGKCGRCNVGDKFVCKDGPVFCMTELDELPDEY